MLQTDLINKFLQGKRIAVVGVSRKKDIPANGIFQKFRKSGYEVFPINPNAEEVEGEKSYDTIQDLPVKPDCVLLAAQPNVSEQVVEDCISMGIENIWMHRGIGTGSYSAKAEQRCKDKGIEAITNGCPMMYIKPVDPFHRIFKWFK